MKCFITNEKYIHEYFSFYIIIIIYFYPILGSCYNPGQFFFPFHRVSKEHNTLEIELPRDL